MKKTSWKTTVGGVGAILTALGILCSMATDEKLDAAKAFSALTGISAGIGLIAARDNKVTSEDVAAK